MKNVLKVLEFDKVVQQLSQFAMSDIGQANCQQLTPLKSFNDVRTALHDTYDATELLRLKGGIPQVAMKDLTAYLKRLEIDATLSATELAHILKVLTSTTQMIRFYNDSAADNIKLKSVDRWFKQLIDLNSITLQVQQIVSEDGRILDDASVTLKGIRTRMKTTEQHIKDKMAQFIRTKQAQLSDAIITVRNDRYVLPVKQEYRYQFGGMVHDQSASGQTVYVEPQEALELNNQLHVLKAKERDEIAKILFEISQTIKPYRIDIATNNRVLGQLDFIQAKALYAKALKAVMPKVSETNEVELIGARHPLIDAQKVVKNDIIIGGEFQSIVITGPNTGGKTILLKTLGLLQLMAQAGLHISADEGSQIGIFTQIFADIGDEQSIEQNLSTFSSHMTKIVRILKTIDEKSLVLFDELGSGTDPQEGAALAIAILDYIGTKGSYVVATTHYPELKMYGYNRLKTVNASMEFDSQTLAPTYKFLLGIPGRSNALDISKRLGLPDSIVSNARSLMHEDSQQVNDMISALETLRQSVEADKEQARRDVHQANQLLAQAQKEMQTIENTAFKLEQEAIKKANDIVRTATEESEKIITHIRQLQLKQGHAVVKEHELIAQKTALNQLKHEESLQKNKVLQKAKRQKNLVVGDEVEVMSYGQRGTIEQKVNDREFVVKMGLLKMKVALDDLRLLTHATNDKQKYIPKLKGARIKVTSQLDLRGQRYENALVELDRYLDAAILAGYPQVTIVHGRGTGAVRDGVTKALRKHRGVDTFEFAPINQGGNGATIVRFKG